MKKKTLQILALMIGLFSMSIKANAQTTVTVNTAGSWNGYMNCFDLSNAYLWGSGWGLADMKSTINASTARVTLQPNFNTYNSTDPYWSNGAIGNKNLEANTYLETTSLINQTVTFTGYVYSNTLPAGYSKKAFVKALDPALGYMTVVNQTITLPASGIFNVSAIIPNTAGLIVQYGFTIYGLNANPTSEAALGSVVVGPVFPLPLDLVDFNASVRNNDVSLTWTTQNEVNVASFEIEKSIDGKIFDKFQTIAATNEVEATYSAQDNIFSNTYYRLKMIDLDGKFTFSEVLKVNITSTENYNLYPNPAADFVVLNTNSIANSTAALYDVTGIKMKDIAINGMNTKIDITSLNAGMYFIKCKNGDVLIFTKK